MDLILEGPKDKTKLSNVLDEYLHELGKVCHSSFGSNEEEAMYNTIGVYFLKYLKEKCKICFTENDPWLRYVSIVKFFTNVGFCAHVELKKLEHGRYYMLETEQFTESVWLEHGSWQRGVLLCPLWSVVLNSLKQIKTTLVIDTVHYNEKANGFESEFHFVNTEIDDGNYLAYAKQNELTPICSYCKKIRDDQRSWVLFEDYFVDEEKVEMTHGVCPDCMKRVTSKLHHYISLG